MLKFLSKVRVEFNAIDPRISGCIEFLSQCQTRKAKESNAECQIIVKRRTDDFPPQISITFCNGFSQVFDATSITAQAIRAIVIEKSLSLETEQMFRDNGESWPVLIPPDELLLPSPGVKARKVVDKKQ